jgi:hypothetical protein
MHRVSHHLFIATFSLWLTACGGGGGGGGGSSNSTPSSTTFPVAQAYSQLLINGMQSNVKVSGKVSDITISGTGSYTLTPAVAATFEQQAAMSTVETFALNVTANEQSVSDTTTSYSYYNTNYNLIGSVADGAYTVADTVTGLALPLSVHVNDKGEMGTATAYADSSKALPATGRISVSYEATADTATTIIFAITTKFYDAANTLTETDIYRYRITDTAVATYLSLSGTTSDGDNISYTFQ